MRITRTGDFAKKIERYRGVVAVLDRGRRKGEKMRKVALNLINTSKEDDDDESPRREFNDSRFVPFLVFFPPRMLPGNSISRLECDRCFKYLRDENFLNRTCFLIHEIIHRTENNIPNSPANFHSLYSSRVSFPFSFHAFLRENSKFEIARSSGLEFLTFVVSKKRKEKKREKRKKRSDILERQEESAIEVHELTRADENGGVRSNRSNSSTGISWQSLR